MKRNIISRITMAAVSAAMAVFTFTSCHGIYEDLDPCPRGVSLRFVYDYNMEYANAFPNKVDCLTLYVYDSDGNYVTTRTETTSVLSDEAYRMEIDLEEGDYHFVAYGGIACSNASFATVSEPANGSALSTLSTVLQHDGATSDKELHGFYFGELDLTVDGSGTTYTSGTVEMMKNTNNIRLILQQLNGNPVSDSDFTFSITDDNTLFDCHNNIVSNGTITYLPWATGQQSTGTVTRAEEEVVVAYAELSCSRLVTSNSPRLVVNRTSDNQTIIDIPLNNYLLLVKSEAYTSMGSQEFLDRTSEWSLVFFLDSSLDWVKTQMVINDWVVRINDSSL